MFLYLFQVLKEHANALPQFASEFVEKGAFAINKINNLIS